MKLTIEVFKVDDWVRANVEDPGSGALWASMTAPLTEGATFDMRKAIIREVIEEALTKLAEASE
jgi:hypothetical protein